MRVDRFTKIILTIIALALVFNLFKPAQKLVLPESAFASNITRGTEFIYTTNSEGNVIYSWKHLDPHEAFDKEGYRMELTAVGKTKSED